MALALQVRVDADWLIFIPYFSAEESMTEAEPNQLNSPLKREAVDAFSLTNDEHIKELATLVAARNMRLIFPGQTNLRFERI